MLVLPVHELENLGFRFDAIKDGESLRLSVSINEDDTGARIVEVATAGQDGQVLHNHPWALEFDEHTAAEHLSGLGYSDVALAQ